MSVHTRTRHTKSKRSKSVSVRVAHKKRPTWRDVAKKEINKFSEPGVMLRGCRYKKNITQAQLSKAINVQQNHISEMENGKRPIGKEMAKRFAEYFKTDYRVFL